LSKVFIDTAAWIALFNRSDALHKQAKQVEKLLRQQNVLLVTTEFVFLEVADAFCTSATRTQVANFIDGLRSLTLLKIVEIEQPLYLEGWQLYKQRLDKNWSLTDCISFAVMKREKIDKAFTSDHHFEQAGFIKLL
jgi:predicted nucleic acid-binding protein